MGSSDQPAKQWSFRPVIYVWAALLLCSPLLAQSSSSSSSSGDESEGPVIPRVWAGLTGSYTPLKQVRAHATTDATTGYEFASTAANGEAGVGADLNARLAAGFWLSVGMIYRFAGFDTSETLNDSAGDLYIYRTRSRYYDFPLLVRYAGRKYRWSKYSFYEAGGTWRHATVATSTGAANSEGLICCAAPLSVALQSNVAGFVVGTGLIGRDEFGMVVTPEIRYTRWTGDTFHSSSLASEKNQVEVTLTFGF